MKEGEKATLDITRCVDQHKHVGGRDSDVDI